MNLLNKRIKVIFSCPQCGAVYEVVQEHNRGSGKFNCANCQATVLSWNGYYHFTSWLPLRMDSGE